MNQMDLGPFGKILYGFSYVLFAIFQFDQYNYHCQPIFIASTFQKDVVFPKMLSICQKRLISVFTVTLKYGLRNVPGFSANV